MKRQNRKVPLKSCIALVIITTLVIDNVTCIYRTILGNNINPIHIQILCTRIELVHLFHFHVLTIQLIIMKFAEILSGGK